MQVWCSGERKKGSFLCNFYCMTCIATFNCEFNIINKFNDVGYVPFGLWTKERNKCAAKSSYGILKVIYNLRQENKSFSYYAHSFVPFKENATKRMKIQTWCNTQFTSDTLSQWYSHDKLRIRQKTNKWRKRAK